MRRTRRSAPRAARVAVITVVAAAAALSAASAAAAARAPGTGTPPAGTGINTAAAFANPQCDKNAGPYGRMNFVFEGFGPVCVAEWKKGADNGGATSQGVTKDKIKVVVLVPNDAQLAGARPGQTPVDHTTDKTGTVTNAFKDTFAAFQEAHETYGRSFDLEFVTSSGDDESQQRADAVTVKAKKPFAVIDGTYTSEPVFGTALAADKIPVFANTTSLESTLKQAPYRWGQTDVNAGAINAAEFMGKQLVGKKAAYAGDKAVQDQTRTFGVIYGTPVTNTEQFDKTAAKYGLKFAPGATLSYPANDDPFGDPAVAQEQAPIAITKFKSAGVTTVLLLSDAGMTMALLKQATANDYHPEWIIGAFNYNDIPFFARQYDQDQWRHAFGISNLPPPIKADDSAGAVNPALDAVQWYWGEGRGTSSVLHGNLVDKFTQAVMYAGPKLTPKTLQQGLFAVPAQGGSAEDSVYTIRQGFGKTSGLPYDEYLAGNKDFTLAWWDPDTEGPPLPNLGLPGGPGALYYLNGGQRFYASHWPTKPQKFFDKSNSIIQFDGPPTPPVEVPCTGCPSETGEGEPASAS